MYLCTRRLLIEIGLNDACPSETFSAAFCVVHLCSQTQLAATARAIESITAALQDATLTHVMLIFAQDNPR